VAGWLIEEHGTRVRDFIHALNDDRAFKEARALIDLLADQGNRLQRPRSKPLGDGLFEMRGRQVRIFYTFRPGRRIVLLDAMVKKRDDIPPEVLAKVRRLNKQVR
jgi:hypothetical protein